ncbi:uncharacterized protein LOC120681600 isoform X6 [Panicum virgatum]|uniref:uncharacterized protein LOC120681600 isoform X6 n=1 Tax=Panicum virgatum TaxID=38727 RepID=UPI0019D5562A|nr:uncharacterized protein LOC120681600 isoform X6 [Panicum virgatum]
MCNFHRRILLMMAYAHTIVFKFLCRLGKADERCARLELGCRYSAVRPTLVLGQHGGCVLFRDYAFGDLAQRRRIHAPLLFFLYYIHRLLNTRRFLAFKTAVESPVWRDVAAAHDPCCVYEDRCFGPS